MTTDELRVQLTHLVSRYVTDQAEKVRLLACLLHPDIPAKGILAQLNTFMSGAIDETDDKVVKEIAFYFC